MRAKSALTVVASKRGVVLAWWRAWRAGGPGDAFASVVALVEVGCGLCGAERGLDVDEVVDAAAGTGAVAAGDVGVEDDPQATVLDSEDDQITGLAGDVPGQRPPKAHRSDRAGLIRRDELAGQAVASSFLVSEGDEVGDVFTDFVAAQGLAAVTVGAPVVVAGEEQLAGRNDALQDTDRGDDGGNGDPRHVPLGAGGEVVAVFVDGGLELAGANQMPGALAVVGGRIGTAARAHAGRGGPRCGPARAPPGPRPTSPAGPRPGCAHRAEHSSAVCPVRCTESSSSW